jgi:uncharacterized protein YkwD
MTLRDAMPGHFLFLILLVFFQWISLDLVAQSSVQRNYYENTGNVDFRKDDLFNEEIDFRNIDFARINTILFLLTNEIRSRNHLQPLQYSPLLENSAAMHARDMLVDDFFGHLNPRHPDKKTPNDRASLCGVTNPFLAENIIEGYGLRYKSNATVYLRGKGKFSSTPDGELIKPHTYLSFGESLMTGWMNSKDHRKNILAAEALQLGCGVAFYVDTEFNDMPSFKAVQNFQWYHLIIPSNQ